MQLHCKYREYHSIAALRKTGQMRNDVVKIMLVLKDVRVRESTLELNTFVNPFLPFPCIFQVVPDKIVAFEQVTLQDFTAIIVPLKCTETFQTSTFVEVVRSMGGNVPKMIYMVAHADTVGPRQSTGCLSLKLERDGSIPLHDLVGVVTAVAQPPPPEVAPPPAPTNLPVKCHYRDLEPTQLAIAASYWDEAMAATNSRVRGKRARIEHARSEAFPLSLGAPPAFASAPTPAEAHVHMMAMDQYMRDTQIHPMWQQQGLADLTTYTQASSSSGVSQPVTRTDTTCESADGDNRRANECAAAVPKDYAELDGFDSFGDLDLC